MAAAISFCLSTSIVHAAEIETLTIKKQTSHYMNMGQQITRIAVGDPNIANVVQLPGSVKEFLIVTKNAVGSTALFVWTNDGMRHEYTIVISPEDPGRAQLIERAINLPDVHVKMVDERILLTGTVENQYQKNYALQTARLFVNASTESSLLVGSGFDMTLETDSAKNSSSSNIEVSKSETSGEIIDLLQILHPTQIRLEAQIVEINSDNAKNLGIEYGVDGSGGIFTFGEANDRTVTSESYTYTEDNGSTEVSTYTYGSNVRPFHNNPIKWISQRFGSINATVHLLVSQGKARILSRPSVMTLSGEKATIQIGGKIPYTSMTTTGGSNVQFEDYGIILQFRPVVDAQGRINSAVHTEVSSIGDLSVNGQPSINTRRADSVVTLQSGASIVVGGLMDSTEAERVQKIPLLGDIPILGEFFKHTVRSRDKTELIIVVTPYLVDEDGRSQTLMTDAMREWLYQEKQYRDAMSNFDFDRPNFEGVSKETKNRKKTEEPFK